MSITIYCMKSLDFPSKMKRNFVDATIYQEKKIENMHIVVKSSNHKAKKKKMKQN